MKRIAVISSDKVLERTVVLAIECSAAGRARAASCGERVEVVPLSDAALCDGTACTCDTLVVMGAAGFVSGRLSAAVLKGGHGRRPQIIVISWQHAEQTVLGLIECGVDQYMTFPLSLRRLCLKLLEQRKF